ncbi:MAG: hypothetical protein PHR56_07440 [Dehalococcoidales bacterium]|nr:hypothetical protein [Dehalococcoidales bacterium]
MPDIDNKYITDAIDELINYLGIKRDIPSEVVYKPLLGGNIKKSIEKIVSYLGLPVAVNLLFTDTFESHDLVKTSHSGRGVGGITAQVSIPGYLPFYGTSGLQDFPITVKVSRNCKKYPKVFAAIMAHEFSHVVLHCLCHKEKENEFYTDLAAMILGFSEIMRLGRKVIENKQSYSSVETTTTTYGYLSDEQFDFAFLKIKSTLKKSIDSYIDWNGKVFQKLTIYKKQLLSYKRKLFQFNRFLVYLDEHQSKRIIKEDLTKIILFHQLDYAEKFTAVASTHSERLKEVSSVHYGFPQVTRHYTRQRLDSLQTLHEQIGTLVSDIEEKYALLNDDVSILRKYVNTLYQLKIHRQTVQ